MTNPKHTDTSRSGDLVAAMKDQLESWEFEDPRESWWKWQHQYAQAADRIEALEVENGRLRGALGLIIENESADTGYGNSSAKIAHAALGDWKPEAGDLGGDHVR